MIHKVPWLRKVLNPRRAALLAVALLLLSPAVLAFFVFSYAHSPRILGEDMLVAVPRGAGASAVIGLVEEKGLGSWHFGNYWAMRVWGEPAAIKAGVYRFSRGMSLVRFFGDIAAGRVDLVRVTLPEGLTAREMAPILADAGVTDSAGFVALAYAPGSAARWGVPGPTMEGYLFPDTYKFARALPPEAVLDAMAARFKAVAAEVSPGLRAGNLDAGQWVTMASIVEKESGNKDERPLVASVFLNRLRLGMKLQSDPTVIYGIRDFDGNIRKADLLRDTPYNTYTRKGIPPGPIANPGRQSLEAVLRPAATDYLYFVSRNDGTHAFSRDYRQHTSLVRRYQMGKK